MLLLDSTSSILEVVTGGAQVTHVTASWVDLDGTTVAPAVPPQNTNISSATTTTIVGSPASGYSRNIKNVCILNTDSTNANTITVEHYDGTTTSKIRSVSLAAGYSLNYEDKRGWYISDANGNEVYDQTALHGCFVKTTVVTSGTSFTTSATTNTLRVRMVAGGGQGGGGGATAGENGSGGGSGSYAEWTTAVSPSTAYTYAIGAGGSTGGTAANGQTGGNTTLTVGSTTVTCNGGVGGLVGTSGAVPVMGSLGGAVSTNGTLNLAGNAGLPAIGGTAADGSSGNGADSPFGPGGNAQQEASNATGLAAPSGSYGAGGGGGTTTGTSRAGGAGAGGVIVFDEYT